MSKYEKKFKRHKCKPAKENRYCECGNLATILRHTGNICARCDQIEQSFRYDQRGAEEVKRDEMV